MPRISTANLFDKDIRALKAADKVYKRAVGNPKEHIYCQNLATLT